jgi:hypothetical protein
MDTTLGDPHHPRRISDMAGAAVWERLRGLLATNQHVVVAGDAGCGKSCALRLLLTGHVGLWFRCSSDPSLRDGRDRIKEAARRRGPVGSINWIVLEHADLLLADAQAFLRRVIETAVGSTRFVLEVRDLGAVTEPLLSRTVLFNVPPLLEYEVRAEIQRRAPGVGAEKAGRLALQAGGNVRWAVLQALGSGDGFLDGEGSWTDTDVSDWRSLLAVMEGLQGSGSSPRAYLGDQVTADVWDRPGGACPWAITAAALSASIE